MTVNEAAKKYGISKQMVYRLLNQSGKPIDELKDPKTGTLTEQGETLLVNRYGEVNRVDSKQVDGLKAELDAMKAANEALSAQLVQLTERYQALQEEHERLHSHLTAAFDSIKNLSTLALPAAPPKKRHWWNR